MRVIVATHHHFSMLPDGTVYPYAGHDYKFLSRYLKVFDEVIIFSRLRKVEALDPKSVPDKASGPGVTFLPVPYFKGALSYLRNRTKVFNLARQMVQGDDAFILRMPSHICTIVWRELMKAKHPYGVEMMADPWQALSPGSLPSVLRPFLRRKWTQDAIQQCRHAATAAYVTKFELQKRYPPGGWSTYYSSVELLEEIIVNKTSVEKRIERIRSKAEANERWRICFVGSLWHLVKAPDILISAVASCVRRGINLELTIIGGGSFRQQLEVQARQQGIADRTVFLGQLPPGEAIYEQLDKSDLYVLPSRSEGLPRSLIEAMARGLPCIGSAVGGFVELLDAEDLVPPRDAAALSAKIESVIHNPDILEKMARRNFQTAKKYRSDKLNRRRIAHYRRLKEVTEAYISSKKH